MRIIFKKNLVFSIIVALLLTISLSACGMSNSDNSNVVGQQDAESVETGTDDSVDEAVNNVVNKVNKANGDKEELELAKTKKLVIFFLDIDGETFEIEMAEQEKYTAYDVLSTYVEKEGTRLVTKKYNFGIFIQGIGDKVGDRDSFWLFYVNGKLANASVDKTTVEPGDVVRFEFMSN